MLLNDNFLDRLMSDRGQLRGGNKRSQMLGSSGKRSPQFEKQEYQSPGEDWPMGAGLSGERESDPSTPYHALTPIQQRQGS